MCNFLRAFREKNHLNWSSEQKIMPDLRRLSELGFVAVETDLDTNRWIGGGLKSFYRLIFLFVDGSGWNKQN
jgi:hypothetical protein